MNGEQMLIAYIGVFLIGLTIWQHWKNEISGVLFDKNYLAAAGGPQIFQPGTGPDPAAKYPYTFNAPTSGAPAGTPGNVVPTF